MPTMPATADTPIPDRLPRYPSATEGKPVARPSGK